MKRYLLLLGSGLVASNTLFDYRHHAATLLARLALRLDSSPTHAPDSYYFPAPGAELYQPHGPHGGDGAEWVNPFPMPFCGRSKIEEASIPDLQEHLNSRKLTSRQLTRCYLERIAQLNKWTNAVLEVNPDALSIADQLDLDRQAGKLKGPLHGIPYLLKDNIATSDKMETTAGSYALMGSIVPRDAHVVKLLRAKGAILLGKTNMDEWACKRVGNNQPGAGDFCEGYSARGGKIYNVYNFSTHPGGSSGGSAHAVASNMAAFSLGTETDGSVTVPARRAGLVGIKPTVGLTSRAGVIPESHTQDTVGTFARSVADAVLALDAIVGKDSRDPYTSYAPTETEGYTQYLTTQKELQGAVFVLPWSSLWMQHSNKDDLPAMLSVLDRLKAAGATIINGTEFPSAGDLLLPEGWTWQPKQYHKSIRYRVDTDFYNDIKAYLSELQNTNVRSVEDLIRYNLDFNDVEGAIPGTLPGFAIGQTGLDASQATLGQENATYWANENWLARASRKEGIDAALTYTDENGRISKVDALLVPSGGAFSTVSAAAGYPIITIPTGIASDGVPRGMALLGTAWSEPVLIKYGSAIEDLIRGREAPRFLAYWDRRININAPW